jgi:hypothetical protein
MLSSMGMAVLTLIIILEKAGLMTTFMVGPD